MVVVVTIVDRYFCRLGDEMVENLKIDDHLMSDVWRARGEGILLVFGKIGRLVV
jgi:hypothetical protein